MKSMMTSYEAVAVRVRGMVLSIGLEFTHQDILALITEELKSAGVEYGYIEKRTHAFVRVYYPIDESSSEESSEGILHLVP